MSAEVYILGIRSHYQNEVLDEKDRTIANKLPENYFIFNMFATVSILLDTRDLILHIVTLILYLCSSEMKSLDLYQGRSDVSQ